MSIISLRDYILEIENSIENGQNEEAIAHCRQILQDFPKYLTAHRLLGKAYLELQQDQAAAAAFKQVLEAVPDDFISHLGMSVIREHEGELDASIRHMERAFDVQPANAVIQGELRRLYKERDGLEPQKIHLTRGALARMYAKGDLYSQAIAELRAALGEDPQRPDLLVVLAKMYAKSGQLLEAAETCNSLLSKQPDCLEAHYILGDILARTERSPEAMTHYQRAAAFDPYAAHISPGQPDPEGVPDESVMLERLEYSAEEPIEIPLTDREQVEEVPASPIIEDQPLEQAEESELEDEASTPEEMPVEPQETGETPVEQIPDWMQSAGWEPATGAVEEAAPEIESELEEFSEEEEELVKAEIPDWLKPLAPSGAEEAVFPEAEEGQAEPVEETPDWLKAAEETQPEAQEELPDLSKVEEVSAELEGGPGSLSAEEMPGEAEAETPDWLQAAEMEQAEPEEETPEWMQAAEMEQAEPEEETPEWMQAAEATGEAEAELPDWMEAAEEEQPEAEAELPDWLKAAEEEGPVAEEELPEWMRAADEEEVGPTAEVPGWLAAAESEAPGQDVLAGEGARIYPTEPEGEPEFAGAGEVESEQPAEWSPDQEIEQAGTEEMAGGAEVPEWLRSLGEESLSEQEEMAGEEVEMPFLPETEEPVQAEMPSGGSEVPDWLRAALEEQEQSQAGQPEDVPDWLRSSIPEGFPEEPPPILGDTKPVRLHEVEEQPVEEPVEGEFEEPVSAELPEFEEEPALEGPEVALPEPPFEEPEETPAEAGAVEPEEVGAFQPEEAGAPETEIEEEAAAMAWLEGLAAREGAREEELLTRPEERSESVPEWLQEVAAEPETEAEGAEEQVPTSEALEEEQPVWQPEMEAGMEGVEEQVPPAEEEVAEEFETEQPAWLGEEQPEEEAAPEEAPLSEEFGTELAAGQAEGEPEAEAEIAAEPAQAPGAKAELPEWLREFVEKDAEPSIVEEAPAEEITPPLAEPLDLNTATLAELERVPGIGYIQAQNIVHYRDSYGPFQSREDLENVPEINPDVIARLEGYGAFERLVEVPHEEVEIQEALPDVEAGSRPPVLEQAWSRLVAGEVSTAVDLYSGLIRNEEHLDQVIHELREAAFLYPHEISLHQALGDAYLRADRLQEALDAYNKAEDLLK